MAFIYRADRDINLSSTEPNDVGPGQYSLRKDIKLGPQSAAPFNISSKRKNSIESFSPGPGRYNLRQNILKKNFSINLTSPDEQSFDLYSNEPKENLFISSEPRFKNENDNLLNPGPGSYNLSNFNLNNSRNNNSSTKNLIPKNNIIYESLSPKRISSIPSKGNCFGYKINNDGELNLLNDPKSYLKYSGDKNDSVGPGRYDILEKKKILGSVQFYKGSGRNLEKSDTSTNKSSVNLSDFDISLSNNQQNRLISAFTKEKNKKTMKIYKNGNLVFKNDINKQDMDLANKNTLSRNNIFPGPGEYYSEYGNAIIPPKPKDIKFQNFGSSQSRSTNSISRSYSNNILDNLLLFPSLPNKIKNEYNIKSQRRPNSNIKINDNHSKLIKQIIEMRKKQKDLVGPGSYNLDKKNKRPTSNIQYFNNLEKRFPDGNYDNHVPGPGIYLNQIDWTPPHKEFNKNKFEEEMIINELERRKKKKNIDSGPSSADYSPEKYSSIESISKKSINKKRPPFNYSEKRFNFNDNKYFNGPGSYNLRKDVVISEGNIPFSVGEKRFDTEVKFDDGASPASYDRDSYFDWNKKSFNVLFL